MLTASASFVYKDKLIVVGYLTGVGRTGKLA